MQESTPTYNTREIKAFLELVSCGLTDACPDAALFEGLSPQSWEQIYRLSVRQTVSGICYPAFCRLPNELLPPDAVLTRWVARVNAIENMSRRMLDAVRELTSAMRSIGLHPVIQKGLSVARFYPQPDLRQCGDIDLWLPSDEMGRGVELARSLCDKVHHHPDGSRSFPFRGFVVELHGRLVNISTPVITRRLDRMAQRLCLERAKANPEGLPTPPPVLELLLVSVHIMRHSFGTGIGLRQICDYAMVASALKGSYDEDLFADLCRRLGIVRWTALLNNFVSTYLKISPDQLPRVAIAEDKVPSPAPLLTIVLEGGNFGHHTQAGCSVEPRPDRGKLHTLRMFLKRSPFAIGLAPGEAFWNFIRLLFGQVH